MSKSLSSLKNRRVNEMYSQPQVSSCSIPSQQHHQSNVQRQPDDNLNKGLTLPQVIQVVDHRLILLENFMNEQKSSSSDGDSSNDFGIIINEFEKRFEILVEEINNLKDIVLNLQAYTMNVNKVLFEERQSINTEINTHEISSIDVTSQTINEVEVQAISA